MVLPDFDQLTQYVYTAADGTIHVADLPPQTDAPEPMPSADDGVAYVEPPTLDERVTAIEETIDVIFGGA